MKPVITGEKDGRSYFAHVGEVDAIESDGFVMRLGWGQDNLPLMLPTSAERPEHDGSLWPPADGVRMTHIVFLPDDEVSQAEGGVLSDSLAESPRRPGWISSRTSGPRGSTSTSAAPSSRPSTHCRCCAPQTARARSSSRPRCPARLARCTR
jgi:hypothetical protein